MVSTSTPNEPDLPRGLLHRLLYIPSAGMKKAAPDFSNTASELRVLWSG